MSETLSTVLLDTITHPTARSASPTVLSYSNSRENQTMHLHLFHVVPGFGEQLFIAATDADRAAGIFTGIAVGAGWELGPFAVERIDDDMPEGLRTGLDRMLQFGLEGAAVFQRPLGWRVISPG